MVTEFIRVVWVLSSSLLGVWFITALVTRVDLLHWAGRPLQVPVSHSGVASRFGHQLLDRMCNGVVTTGLLSLVFLVGTFTVIQLCLTIVT